jgi:hypothetical protein
LAQHGVKTPMFRLLLQPLKQQIAKNGHRRACLPHGSKIKLKVGDYLTKKNWLRAVYHCADYFREYESIFRTAVAHEPVDPEVLFDENNQRSKISWDCLFKYIVVGQKIRKRFE